MNMKALRIYSIALGMAAIMFAGCTGTYLDLTPEMQNVLNNYYKDGYYKLKACMNWQI